MSDSLASLRHKIDSVEDLESVVRTMKTVAASSIGQYENAVHSLDDYYRTVQLGLLACFQKDALATVVSRSEQKENAKIGAIVFGSDQGLVGQFNEVMVEFVMETLDSLPGDKVVWSVGERVQSRLVDTSLQLAGGFIVPNSISAITPLVGKILIEMESQREKGTIDQVYIFYNRPRSMAVYTPVSQQLLPLNRAWQKVIVSNSWPTQNLPEVINGTERTLRALIREYLFVSLFRACAESLASENASRLAAMQRAEKNIEEMQENMNRTFHHLRQSNIDEELFDVVSGFEALTVS